MIKVKDLPEPEVTRTGWPWTEDCSSSQSSKNLPSITIITPNFNYAEYLEATLRSVLLQGYPNLEYMVFDGGSTDDSVRIIEKYAPWLSFYESTPDKGQSDAINKGIVRASGSVVAFLNSDDFYLPETLLKVGHAFASSKEVSWLVGKAQIVDAEGNFKSNYILSSKRDVVNFLAGLWFPQPATFWKKELHEKVGNFDPDLNITLDQEFWLRLKLAGYNPIEHEEVLACHRDHGANKTSGQLLLQEKLERISIIDRYKKLMTADDLAMIEGIKQNHLDYIAIASIANKDVSVFKKIKELLETLIIQPTLLRNRFTWGFVKQLLLQR